MEESRAKQGCRYPAEIYERQTLHQNSEYGAFRRIRLDYPGGDDLRCLSYSPSGLREAPLFSE